MDVVPHKNPPIYCLFGRLVLTAGIGGIAERYAKNTQSHPSSTILRCCTTIPKTGKNLTPGCTNIFDVLFCALQLIQLNKVYFYHPDIHHPFYKIQTYTFTFTITSYGITKFISREVLIKDK